MHVYRGESHDSPDTGVGSVGSLVGALVLGDLVWGVDEAAVRKKESALGYSVGSITTQLNAGLSRNEPLAAARAVFGTAGDGVDNCVDPGKDIRHFE